ncbi:hypothetical protein QE152_g34337 [Popillia japonica]|uniref:Secreted protein n=1 Tax=Popillia japonica TaxID=7064 RepID=A0AAW1ITB9_POPJA
MAAILATSQSSSLGIATFVQLSQGYSCCALRRLPLLVGDCLFNIFAACRCWSGTAYSLYSQLATISEGRSTIRHLVDPVSGNPLRTPSAWVDRTW